MSRRKKQEPPKGAPAWMATFSDLMTLVLVFFVLLFAFSEIDAKKFRSFQESFNQRSIFESNPSMIEFETSGKKVQGQETKENVQQEFNIEGMPKEQVNHMEKEKNEQQLTEVINKVESFLQENHIETNVTANRTPKGVELVLKDNMLFRSGEAKILPDAVPFLRELAELFNQMPNHIIVEGHTDNQPISNMIYPSNWELSAARSSHVVRYFTEKLGMNPQRFVAVGYGQTRPIGNNATPDGRAANRRVVIAISSLSEK